jgi:hypothetical protein
MGFYREEAKDLSQGKCGASAFGLVGEVRLMMQKVRI